MISYSEIAKHLYLSLPTQIQHRLVDNQGFMEGAQLGLGRGVAYSGVGKFRAEVLFEAVRTAFESGTNAIVKNSNGTGVKISLSQKRAHLSSKEKGGAATTNTPKDLMLLSPDREMRIEAFEDLLDDLGPTGPDPLEWYPILKQRPLSARELMGIIGEIRTSLPAQTGRIEECIFRNDVDVDTLIPSSIRYYEKICGPDPGGIHPEQYLKTALMDYRRVLIERDLVRGLDISLLGYLRDDLSPAALVAPRDNDTIWSALENINGYRDPFSLLGLLDIALARAESDVRFRELSADAISKLSAREFVGDNVTDVYKYMPAIIELVHNRFYEFEKMTQRPPFWRRLCAWTHASLLARVLSQLRFDPAGLSQWCQNFESEGGRLAATVDFQREPMWPPEGLVPRTLRGEILGRLQLIRQRHKKNGVTIPNEERIDKSIEEVQEKKEWFGLVLPGPLDGHIRPVEREGTMGIPKELREPLLADLVPNLTVNTWWPLGTICQTFKIDSEIEAKIKGYLKKSEFGGNQNDREKEYATMSSLCLVAAANRDVELSEMIATKCIDVADRVVSAQESRAILLIMFFASAAIEKREDSVKWLEEKLLPFVSRLPKGESCKVVYESIRIFKQYISVEAGQLSRVEALARMGS